MIDLLEIECYF